VEATAEDPFKQHKHLACLTPEKSPLAHQRNYRDCLTGWRPPGTGRQSASNIAASAAANVDPIEFRLKHLDDPRAGKVIETVANRFDWEHGRKAGRYHGRGFAFAKYKNLAAYVAIALDLEVDRESGRIRLGRAVAADDSGQAVNPDGIKNQVEGAIVQAASWTLFEDVAFDRTRIKSRDWATYPILRFQDVFQSIEVEIIDHPGQPYLGTGEGGQGPTAAAIANAVANATGRRIRELPFSRDRVKAALLQRI